MTTQHAAHIFLVDDNPGDLLLTTVALGKWRLKPLVNVAHDGEEALNYLFGFGQFAGRATPDLILLDINLPKVNGFEVLERIKRDPSLLRIPVVVLTSSIREDDVVKAYNEHANSFITKSTDMKGLVQALQCLEDYWFVHVRRAAQIG